MGLIDLKSDLVWNGPKIPGLYVEETAFSLGEKKDPIPEVYIYGLKRVVRKTIQTNNTVSLFNSQFDQGIASRKSQGGIGHPFPDYGATKYDWEPIPHTGFSAFNRYSTAIKNTDTINGAAYGFLYNSYTTHSPIDDEYRKFKLRDSSYNPSYIKQPYILRGIQREDIQEPQRWGLDVPAVFDSPSGGIITSTSRIGADVERISKFLVSPKGLIFNATQFGLQLMNPNVENASGVAITPFENYSKSSKTYLPVNLLGNIAGSALGVRLTRHGIGTDTYRYEDTILRTRSGDAQTNANRLVKLYVDLSETQTQNTSTYSELIKQIGNGDTPTAITQAINTIFSKNKLNQPIKILSGVTGPNTALGIGQTNISRRTDTFELGRQWITEHNKTATNLDIKYNQATDVDKKYGDFNFDDDFTSVPGAKDIALGQRYATLTYSKLEKNVSKNFVKDLDQDKLPKKYKDKLNTDYNAVNRHNTYGVIDYANNTNVPEENYTKDFIKFEFAPHGSSSPITFRAYLNSLSDDHTGEWEAQRYQGNAYNKYKQDSYTRRIMISFHVAAMTSSELTKIYTKLTKLAQLTMPNYIGNGFVGRFIDVTVGNMFDKTPCILDSVSYTWDVTETPWELESGKQLPKYANVDMQLTYIGKTAANINSDIYAFTK